MGVLKGLRDTLVADLAVLEVPVHATWPAPFVAPCVFVIPPLASSYITAGPNFGGEFLVSLDVVIVAAHAPAEEGLAALESLLELALVNTADWRLEGVEPPAPSTVTDGGAEYLATAIHLIKPVRL